MDSVDLEAHGGKKETPGWSGRASRRDTCTYIGKTGGQSCCQRGWLPL